jgi:hypothetical protein
LTKLTTVVERQGDIVLAIPFGNQILLSLFLPRADIVGSGLTSKQYCTILDVAMIGAPPGQLGESSAQLFRQDRA